MSENDSKDHAQERLYESLSALLDGEASEIELRRVLDGIENDVDLKQKASRYQYIGNAIRREPHQLSTTDLSAKIMAAIDKEDSAAVDAKELKSRKNLIVGLFSSWPSALGKFSAAALVMFAVVFSLRNYNVQQQQIEPLVDANMPDSVITIDPAIQIKSNDSAASGILAGLNDQVSETKSSDQFADAKTVADVQTRARFQAYALQHAELSVMSTGHGVLPFARLISFEVQ